MSVNSEITALENYLSSAYGKISDKGGTLPQNKNMSNLATAIDSIPTSSIIIIPPSAGTLTSISVTSNPNKTIYNEGENFDFTGLVITALYSSGQQYNVTNSCTYTMNQPLQYGDSSILATYETQTTTISITVNAVPVPAPTTTVHLVHFNGDLIDSVTNQNYPTSSSYREIGAGKFGKAQNCAYSSNSANLFRFETTGTSRADGLTIEFWARTDGNGSKPLWLNWGGQSSDYRPLFDTDKEITSVGFELSTWNGTCNATNGLFSSQTKVTIPSSNLAQGSWHHYAFVYQGSDFKFFLDGTLMTTAVILNLPMLVKFTSIGSYAYNGVNAIDELLVCTSAKYSSNFIPNHSPYYIQA